MRRRWLLPELSWEWDRLTAIDCVESQVKFVIEGPLTCSDLILIMQSLLTTDWFPSTITGIEYSSAHGPMIVTFRRALPSEEFEE